MSEEKNGLKWHSKKEIAAHFGIGVRTVTDWMRRRIRFHSDSDNTPFAFELNFFVRGRAISFQTKSVTQSNRPLNPKKLRLSKWTAVNPQEKEKHFLVARVIDPEQPKHLIELVVMEAVLTKRSFTMRWEELTDAMKWVQGWQQ